MTDKRSYKEVLASVETSLTYINNHLANIDSHLNKLNERTGDCEVSTAKNKDRISLIYKIGGGFLTTLLAGSLAVGLHLMGIY